jgi:CMP/dCMP kinase
MLETIAMDGPAASGKSTIAKLLADHFGLLFFDTGIMYRAVTLGALLENIPIMDEESVSQLAEQMEIDVAPPSIEDGRTNDILLEGVDHTWAVRQPEVDENVSIVAAYPGVRAALTKQQRRIGQRGRIIMVGRDIGTVVMPEAALKIYLDASAEERARRRYEECLAREEEVSYESVLAVVKKRDQIDSERDVAPLMQAEDAILVNSDGKNIDQVYQEIKALVEEKLIGSKG